MKRIDTSRWNTYKITDIFLIKNTNWVLSRDITPDSGVYPYVTASSVNNGISTYVNVDPLLLDKGNCILIGGKTLAFSYQENDFVSNDSHNLALYLIESKYRKENVYLFLITALKHRYPKVISGVTQFHFGLSKRIPFCCLRALMELLIIILWKRS